MTAQELLEFLNKAIADNPKLGGCKIYTNSHYEINFNKIEKLPIFGFTQHGNWADFDEESEKPNAVLIKIH